MDANANMDKRPKRRPLRQDLERVTGEELERLRSEKLPFFGKLVSDQPPLPFDDGELEHEP